MHELNLTKAADARRVAELLGFDYAIAVDSATEDTLKETRKPDLEHRETKQSDTVRDREADIRAKASARQERTEVPSANDAWVTVSSVRKRAAVYGNSTLRAYAAEEPTENDPLPVAQLSIPLFRPNLERSILFEALSLQQESGDLHTEKLIETFSQLKPVTTLPRRKIPTLCEGAHVIVDTDESIGPFAEDTSQIIRSLRTLLPNDLLRISHCRGSPLRRNALTGYDLERGFEYPPPGMPVLVLSTLGQRGSRVGSHEALENWSLFGQRLRRLACPAVVVVPSSAARFPRSIYNFFAIVQWNRQTNSRAVRVSRRRAEKAMI